ncbi:hypothetical protein [Nocardiopsis suaedae]|uniref:Uncharacterized protein n=1 Tax=Nocardiopsis suaedae TaxID=3018444 RepID=A0ABT4TML5_9ACTN|nr:hypothetical protein [Nocardiopsis suaedae]MDA2805489.1 hypothetical protein [Nocardiopsis suaedae]
MRAARGTATRPGNAPALSERPDTGTGNGTGTAWSTGTAVDFSDAVTIAVGSFRGAGPVTAWLPAGLVPPGAE